jgi:hypothetical protein
MSKMDNMAIVCQRAGWGRFEWDITLLPGHFTGNHIILGGIYPISCRLHFLGVHEVKTCLIVPLRRSSTQ